MRARTVALSGRLQRELRQWWLAQGRPDANAFVVPGADQANFRNRHFREVCKWADRELAPELTLGEARSPKDLRDTFASQLLTAGVQLGYVSRQLGHAGVAVTSDHYARWCGGDEYRAPMELRPGEVPADLLARIVSTCDPSQHLTHHLADA